MRRRLKKIDIHSQWYDRFYLEDLASGGDCTVAASASVYAPAWSTVLSRIELVERIADFGCGVGQLAELAAARGYDYKLGVDFSQVAVEAARKRNPQLADRFVVADLNQTDLLVSEYDVAVFTETLEHLRDDLTVLSKIPSGRHVVLTVPSFDYTSHFRFFPDAAGCWRYYADVLEILSLQGTPFGGAFTKKKGLILWVLNGRKR